MQILLYCMELSYITIIFHIFSFSFSFFFLQFLNNFIYNFNFPLFFLTSHNSAVDFNFCVFFEFIPLGHHRLPKVRTYICTNILARGIHRRVEFYFVFTPIRSFLFNESAHIFRVSNIHFFLQ